MPETNQIIEELKDEILKWNSSELLQIITIIGSLPQNNEKIPRLEALFKIIISLPKDKFKDSDFDMKSLQTILHKLSQTYYWDSVEDHSPISVLDYPPVWILGKRYRVFPGLIDRTYEYWKDLIRRYFDIKDEFISKCGYDPVVIIQQILSLETRLVEVIEKNHSSCESVNDLYIPTQKIILRWQEIIKKWKKNANLTFFNKYSINCGELEIKNFFEIESIDNIYKFFIVGTETSIIFPHTFHDFLIIAFRNDQSKIKTEIQEKIIASAKYHLFKKLCRFFSKNEIISEFSLDGINRLDFAVFFDNNKLFVFKILHLDFIDDIKSIWGNLFDNFEKIEKKISEGTTAFYHNGKKIGDLPHNDIEVIPIVLFDITKIHKKIELSKHRYLNSKDVWIGFYFDFLSILDEFEDFMRFLKFLRRKNALQNKITIQRSSDLDLLAYYLQNNDSIFIKGKIPHMVSVLPDLWDKFKINQIKKRPDFQARYEESEGDDFWELKVVEDSLFSVRNAVSGDIANVFLLPSKRKIWILAMNKNTQCEENEINCIRSLTGLIPHRFINNNILDNMLQHLSISQDTTICFSLMPTRKIIEKNIKPMQQFLPSITTESPIIVKHFIAPDGTVIFYFIYSPNYFISFRNNEPLEGEKYVLKQLLNELCIYAKIENVKEVSTTYLNELFQNASAAFSFTKIPLRVFTPTLQTHYPSTLQSDESEITRMIAEFLTTLNISPGIYEKKDAKEILNKIYDFLNSKFIVRISKIKQSTLLPFLLHSEGQIIKDMEMNREKTKHQSQFQMEYDPMKKFSEKNKELNILLEAYSYSIEIAIKHWSEGSEIFILEDWLELQALAEQIFICSGYNSYLFFGLGEYQFCIFEDYSFELKPKNISALEDFSDNFDKFVISSEKSTENEYATESSNQLIDEPFEDEFKITFKKLCNVIDVCLYYLKEIKKETKLVTIDELHKFNISIYPEISKEEFMNGLSILSLTEENMSHNFYPSDIRNRQYRHGCKPIIKFPDNEHYLINSWSLDNVIQRILYEINRGYLLYNDNFIDSKLLTDHLRSLREKANRHHEKDVYELFKTKTQFTELNIKKENKIFLNIDEELPGEIDTLAVFADVKEMYLIESKNIKMNYAARDMSNEIKKFIKPNGYTDKFTRKIKFIKKHLPKILEYYGIFDTRGWKIKSYFVTSNVSFPKQNFKEFQFITKIDLEKMISNY